MIIPYLYFQGNCEEAISLYCETLGGHVEFMSRYTPETGGSALGGKVMHVEMSFGTGKLAAGDRAESVQRTDGMMLMVHCATAAEANRILERFGAQGTVLQRLMPHPPPDDGGMGALVCDAYGVTWILTAPNDRR